MNNWERWLNCPFQISMASSVIHFASFLLIFLPRPICVFPLLCHHLDSHLFLLHFFLPYFDLPILYFLLYPLLSCAADVDPILWQVVQEGMDCLLDWSAGLCVSSVSKTRCCFRVLLGAVFLSLSLSQLFHSSHTHTHSFLFLSVSTVLAPSQSPSTPLLLTYFHCTS